MPRIGLQCVNLVFPDHTHLLFEREKASLLRSRFVHVYCIIKKHLHAAVSKKSCLLDPFFPGNSSLQNLIKRLFMFLTEDNK